MSRAIRRDSVQRDEGAIGGVATSGWEDASEAFRWVASQFTTGEAFRLEDGGPPGPNRLRVTHVYRPENGRWKIVHRHGDGLEADQVPRTGIGARAS